MVVVNQKNSKEQFQRTILRPMMLYETLLLGYLQEQNNKQKKLGWEFLNDVSQNKKEIHLRCLVMYNVIWYT